MQAVVCGATGLVGDALLGALSQAGIATTAIARRKGTQRTDVEWRITELTALTAADIPDGATVAFCTLGTTIKSAGSQEAFRAVDHGLVLAFAKACRAAGIATFVVVSAAGANPASRVFYSRVKGEVERDLRELGFASLSMLRPGLLLGDRKEKRILERAAIRVTQVLRPVLPGPARGVSAQVVARALLTCAQQAPLGVHILDNVQIEQRGA